MSNYSTSSFQKEMINKETLLAHWQGHRALTRRIIEQFPEEAFFDHRIGGMRPFAEMVVEILASTAPVIIAIVTGKEAVRQSVEHRNQKSILLEQ